MVIKKADLKKSAFLFINIEEVKSNITLTLNFVYNYNFKLLLDRFQLQLRFHLD